MFYKTREELNVAVDKIFAIYRRLIGATKNLGPKERFNSWKEAVKAISGELDSVRAIARLTDTVPRTLIRVDKYVRWSDDIGSPDTPFPNWKVALRPDDADIAGHPWLMKVECRFDVILTGQTPQSLPSTSQPAAPTATRMVKEKGRATDVGVKVRTGQERLAGATDDDGESEVEDTDQLMDDDNDEKRRPWGRSRQRKPRTTAGRRSKSQGKQHEVDELEYEDNGASKKSKPSTSRASEVPRTPIAERAALPSDPNPCETCIFRHIDCVPNPRGGVCKPCKSRKIRCSHSTRPPEHPATAPRKAAPTTSSTPRRKRSRTRTPRRQRSESTSPHETDEEEVAHVRKKARVSGAADVAPRQSVKAGTSGQNRDWGKYCFITPFVSLTVILAVVIPQSKRPTIRLVPPAVRSVSSMEDVADATSTGLRDADISPSPAATTTAAVSTEDHAVKHGAPTLRDEDLSSHMANFEMRLHELERWPQEATLGVLENRVRTLEDRIQDYEGVMGSMAREIEALRSYIHSRELRPQQTDDDAMIREQPIQGDLPRVGSQMQSVECAAETSQHPNQGEDLAPPVALQSEAMVTVDAPVQRPGDMDVSVSGSTNDELGVGVGETDVMPAVAMNVQTEPSAEPSTPTHHSPQPDNEPPVAVDPSHTMDAPETAETPASRGEDSIIDAVQSPAPQQSMETHFG
ncbi:hypothetical protein EDD15DRAFT_2194560 [Pisolithus albus]|nr:hypothetical protein EDD15DRAFT_2194560 [Pisolithus albus]